AGLSTRELLKATVKFAHGTTQTSNVLFTWSGARTALITTRGFGDELLMMRARGRVAGTGLAERRHFRQTEKPPQLVSRAFIEEVNERVDHHGRALVPLTEGEVHRAIDAVLAQGVEAIAVSLLWSPANPAHEQLIGRLLRERAPEVYVRLSHEIAPVLGEYERTATTVVDAYVGPTVRHYLAALGQRLRDEGLTRPLLILQTSGGVAHPDSTVPVNTVESGPAAGMVASRMLAGAAGYDNVIATDVGGTTFKVGLIVGGRWSFAPETVVNQYALLIPAIDLVSVGAGGGSIAWVDDTRLRIGPKSAGADPGPACYGWGGTEPTVTDADLVLGFIDPKRFLGGRQPLDSELARQAIKARIADRLFGGDVVRAASGIRRVVDAQMGDLVRKVSIERGHDPRHFVLMAYGGAGPLHAVGYSRHIGVRAIVIPTAATVYSAFGAAACDIQNTSIRSVQAAFPGALDRMLEGYEVMEREARTLLDRQGVPRETAEMHRWADIRYARQLHDVRVLFPAGADLTETSVRGAFVDRYRLLYGLASLLRDAPLRVLRIGLDAIGIVTKPEMLARDGGAGNSVGAGRSPRPIYWPETEAFVESRVWDGELLRPGDKLEGPGVVEFSGTTIALPPGSNAEIDRFASVVIQPPDVTI
ncbi:MAG: hydantoinase/oxoprolinase family protein, partial [Longimicrobiales bacterium]